MMYALTQLSLTATPGIRQFLPVDPGYGGGQFSEKFVVSQAKLQDQVNRILKEDNELMEVLATVLQSGILS